MAARDVTFAVEAGKLLAVIGPNGAGKSTIFNMVGGQLRPDGGRVTAGRPGHHRPGAAPHLAPRRRPHVPGGADLRVHDGGRERADGADQPARPHAGVVARRERPLPRGGDGAARPRRHGGRRRPALSSELAYGDVKRVELAIALAGAPKLLLMDEPTAGMAPKERAQLMQLIARHRPRARHRRAVHRARHGRRVRATPTTSSCWCAARSSPPAGPTRCAPTRACARSIWAAARRGARACAAPAGMRQRWAGCHPRGRGPRRRLRAGADPVRRVAQRWRAARSSP